MKTAFVLPAAALAAIAYGLVSPPAALAVPIPHACNPVPIPALGINADCGQASNQPGLCRLTGVCAPGGATAAPRLPAVSAPATQAPQAQEGLGPPEPSPLGPPFTGPPMHAPPECANLDYFIQYRIMCEQNGAPYPPGYTPGMNDTPPG